jgi:DNA mismatch endonuclease (patch repair protein)
MAADRSAIMRAVRAKDTAPEVTVRRLAHGLGRRFRLQRRDLPGTPDLTFPKDQKIVFVHGCFWHGHDCPRGARAPKTNVAYWSAKIARNRARDAAALEALAARGWRSLVVWECETKNVAALRRRLARFLLGRPAKSR